MRGGERSPPAQQTLQAKRTEAHTCLKGKLAGAGLPCPSRMMGGEHETVEGARRHPA